MVCTRGGFIIQRHNELRDLEAEMLKMVCNDVQIEPVLQEINGEVLTPGTNRAADARLDIHARGFWERQGSAFFDVRVCYPNAESYRGLTTKQIYLQHESEKKRMYASRVLEVEQGSFTPLVFTTTGGMADECKRYHSSLPNSYQPRRERITVLQCHGFAPKSHSPSWGLRCYAWEAHVVREELRWPLQITILKLIRN